MAILRWGDSADPADMDSLSRLWAKRSKDGGPDRAFHPLICHLVDVMQVCRGLWEACLGDSLRKWLAESLGLDEPMAARWIAFWAASHDLGKAGPSFQRKWPVAEERLKAAGFRFQALPLSLPHGTVTAMVLPALLERLGVGKHMARQVATAVAGHHGVFPSAYDVESARSAVGRDHWEEARLAITNWLARAREST
jgi:CRISPR-associated endonuclease/helicase Cas3